MAIRLNYFFALLSIVGIVACGGGTPSAPKTEAQLKQDRLEKHFSAWDGSHRPLVKWTKERLNDADSFEHVKTTFKEIHSDRLLLSMKYRAKNGFGGVMLQTMAAHADIDSGTILWALTPDGTQYGSTGDPQ